MSEKAESPLKNTSSENVHTPQRYAESVRAMLERRRAEERRGAMGKLNYADPRLSLAELRKRGLPKE